MCPEDRRACEAGVCTSCDLLGEGHTEQTTLPAASWAASPSPRAVGLFRVQHGGGLLPAHEPLVGVLLMYLSQEEAFWPLAQLYAMHGRGWTGRWMDWSSGEPPCRAAAAMGQMCTGIYTPKEFLQCFIDQSPFSLTLKLWDAYILDGERMLTAMAYRILKVHSGELKGSLEGPCA
ncbi:USP6 N-terminal-like protein [Vulpes lagopus]